LPSLCRWRRARRRRVAGSAARAWFSARAPDASAPRTRSASWARARTRRCATPWRAWTRC
jgi:hypothetical protein